MEPKSPVNLPLVVTGSSPRSAAQPTRRSPKYSRVSFVGILQTSLFHPQRGYVASATAIPIGGAE